MKTRTRWILALLTALVVGFGLMAHDRSRGVGWTVSPAQIALAQSTGRPGVEILPGSYASEPIPSDDAWMLPVKWILVGLGAGFAVLAATGMWRPKT